ncbi:MAG: hypothetical protein R3213_13415, partial [Flavobacteriaceae bacterium]|nr:hypothetical protein [Flavobacteriaceae bacterium]
YLMAKAYLEVNGFKVVGDDIFNSKGEKKAIIKDCDYDGMNLHVYCQWLEPIHFIEVNLTLDDLKVKS